MVTSEMNHCLCNVVETKLNQGNSRIFMGTTECKSSIRRQVECPEIRMLQK